MRQTGTKNLTYTQRLQIETLNNAKVKKEEIAKVVGIHLRTLYYELKRGEYYHTFKHTSFWYGTQTKREKRYSAHIAQEKYNLACTAKGRPLKIGNDFELVKYIEKKFKEEKISACATLGEIKRNNLPFTKISKTTLYRYIEIGIFSNIKIQKRKEKYRKVVFKRVSKGKSIEKRPAEILNRNTFGHWEMDCVCGSSRYALLTLSERLTRQEIIMKIPNKQSKTVVNCLNTLEKKFGTKKFKQIFKSITVDNGVEFSDYLGMQHSCITNTQRTQVYYCHPYSSYERGTNERLNREIRRLIPKGSDISKYSTKEIKKVESWINNYPREIFGYATSQEMFNQYIQQLA